MTGMLSQELNLIPTGASFRVMGLEMLADRNDPLSQQGGRAIGFSIP